jgi:hypothetical protein
VGLTWWAKRSEKWGMKRETRQGEPECLARLRDLHEDFVVAARIVNELRLHGEDFRKVCDHQLILTEMRDKLHSLSTGPAPELTETFLAILGISRDQFPTLCARLDELDVKHLSRPGQLGKLQEVGGVLNTWHVADPDINKVAMPTWRAPH